MTRHKRFLLPLAVAIVIGGLLYGGSALDARRAREQDIVSGFFENQPAEVASRVMGRAARLLVREGDVVRAGQPLLILEAEPVAAEESARRAQAEQAAAQLREVRNGARTEDIRRAAAVVAEQEAVLDELQHGSLPEEIGAARARVEQAQATIANAQAGVRTANSNVGVARANISAAMAARRRALNAVDAARATVGATIAGRKRAVENAAAAAAGVRSARAARERAQEGVAAARALVATAGAAVKAARANLAAAQAQSEKAVRDEQRYRELFEGGAISAQTRDSIIAAAKTARAQTVAAREAVGQAVANLNKNRADLKSAQAQVRAAEADIARTRASSAAARATIAEATATVRQNESQMRMAVQSVGEATGNLQRSQKQEAAARGTMQQAATVIGQNRALLREAQNNLQKVKRGPRAEAIAAQQARLNQARNALAALQNGSRPEQVEQARAAERAALANVRGAAANLRERTVRAAQDGIVERVLVAVGDLVPAGTPLLRLANPRDIWIRVYIPELQLPKVNVGNEAQLKVDGIEQPIAAIVESIATQGEFTPANLQTAEERGRQVFGVRLRLKQADRRIKAGMYATVERLGAI